MGLTKKGVVFGLILIMVPLLSCAQEAYYEIENGVFRIDDRSIRLDADTEELLFFFGNDYEVLFGPGTKYYLLQEYPIELAADSNSNELIWMSMDFGDKMISAMIEGIDINMPYHEIMRILEAEGISYQIDEGVENLVIEFDDHPIQGIGYLKDELEHPYAVVLWIRRSTNE